MDVGEVVGGRFEVRRVLEVGACSTLLEAVALDLEQFVVVEVYRRFRREQDNAPFLRELGRVSALRSKHVARVLASGCTPGGSNYVVSEPPEGESLQTLLRRHGPLPLVRIVELTLEVCDALDEAHAAALVHQDLSPETLFVTRLADGSSCMKVRGFGARLAQRAIADRRALGLSHFTAPEQLSGDEPVDARTDIWALGATLYELSTGHPPFEVAPERLETALLTMTPRPLAERRPGLPLPFSEAVMRCLLRSPTNRYDSAAALAEAIAPYGPGRGAPGGVRGALAAGATRLRSSTERVVDLVRQRKW